MIRKDRVRAFVALDHLAEGLVAKSSNNQLWASLHSCLDVASRSTYIIRSYLEGRKCLWPVWQAAVDLQWFKSSGQVVSWCMLLLAHKHGPGFLCCFWSQLSFQACWPVGFSTYLERSWHITWRCHCTYQKVHFLLEAAISSQTLALGSTKGIWVWGRHPNWW